MRLLTSGLALALLASVMAFAPLPEVSTAESGVAMRACSWCNASGAGDGHEFGVAHGVAMKWGLSHGMQSGSCTSHHDYCYDTFAMRFSNLDRLAAVAAAGDMSALQKALADDTEGSLIFNPSEGRLDVKGCEGQTIAVLWMTEEHVAAR